MSRAQESRDLLLPPEMSDLLPYPCKQDNLAPIFTFFMLNVSHVQKNS